MCQAMDSTSIGPDRLMVTGPFGRAFAKCAGCDRLVHGQREYGGFCCVNCCIEYYGLRDSIGHGARCEGDLAADVDPASYRDSEGKPDATFQVATDMLPCTSICSKGVIKMFEKAGLALHEYDPLQPGERASPEQRIRLMRELGKFGQDPQSDSAVSR